MIKGLVSLPGQSLTSVSESLEAWLARLERIKAAGWPVIVIPVFNAAPAVEACLASVRAYTDGRCKVLVIDDASTNPAIAPLMKRFVGEPGFRVVTHTQNCGYTRTVNEGIDLAGQADVILLNSDTRVTPGWVQRLRWAACSEPHIATVTPFSDNAGAFSAPEPGYNPLPEGLRLETAARAVAQGSDRLLPQVPTGNGFCMYIRRACLDTVGGFDEQAFPRGYGEENDFCMRAGRRGWRHLIDDSTYIAHQRSASFGASREALLKEGLAVVDRRYPQYRAEVHRAFNDQHLLQARSRVGALLRYGAESAASIRPRVLQVLSARADSRGISFQALEPGQAVEHLVLRCDGRQMTLEHFEEGTYTQIAGHRLSSAIGASSRWSREYDAVLADWLMEWAIERIQVVDAANHSLGIFAVSSQLGVPTVFT